MIPNKKLILCLCVYFTLATSYTIVKAGNTVVVNEAARVEDYISVLYEQLDFSCSDTLSYTAFNKALHGFLNLKSEGKLNNAMEVISICDFSLPSTANRLWVINLAAKKVLFNTYVAHGQGTGENCAINFSNTANSHKSSLGFYVTTQTYIGEHGLSLRLLGMDKGFNDAAFKRDIVVHGAKYVSEKYICTNQRLGRSWGCPAIPEQLVEPIINTIKDSTCLFIYYPDQKYMKSAYWLNKRVVSLPDYQVYGDMKLTEITKPRFRKIQYVNDSAADSGTGLKQPPPPNL